MYPLRQGGSGQQLRCCLNDGMVLRKAYEACLKGKERKERKKREEMKR